MIKENDNPNEVNKKREFEEVATSVIIGLFVKFKI